MKRVALSLSGLFLMSCTSPSLQGLFETPTAPDTAVVAAAQPAPEVAEVPVETLDPTPPPPPPTSATTVEQFDTTTAEDRAEAQAAPEPAGEQALGVTLATLGSPTDPGIWVKTPLVDALTQGRVEYQGESINVELRPSGGDAGSGSQISLPAMRLLNAPLTGVIELSVFKS